MISSPGATASPTSSQAALAVLRRGALLHAAFCAVLLAPSAARADEAAKPVAGPAAKVADAPTRDVRTYCANIAVAASDARIAWQTARLADLEARLKASIQALDARTAELRALAEKRAAMEKAAGEKLVGIYAKMRAETAATQISGLDDEMAAAVLGQLPPRQASLIFNEIVPDRAAKLAVLIAGLQPEKPSPPERKP